MQKILASLLAVVLVMCMIVGALFNCYGRIVCSGDWIPNFIGYANNIRKFTGFYPYGPKDVVDYSTGAGALPKQALRCPGVLRHRDNKPEIIYLNWQTISGNVSFVPPPDYPMVYDAHTSNHIGGVYVGMTGEKVFWDPHANWLKEFARQHPEFVIPLPD